MSAGGVDDTKVGGGSGGRVEAGGSVVVTENGGEYVEGLKRSHTE